MYAILGTHYCLHHVKVVLYHLFDNIFVPVVWKRILDNLLPLRRIKFSSLLFLLMVWLYIFLTHIFSVQVYCSCVSCQFWKPKSLLCEPISFESFFCSSLNPCFTSIFNWVLSQFFKPSSFLCKSILVKSLVYFSSLHPRFAKLFVFCLLSFYWVFILASWVYFSLVYCVFLNLHPCFESLL